MHWRPVRRLVATASVGISSGLLAGLGAYLLSQPTLRPVADTTAPLALVALAGAYVAVLSDRLRSSVAAMICAFFVGIAVHIGTYLAPLWLLPYSPTARGLLLSSFLVEALVVVYFQYTLVFFVGYLTVVTVSGYVGP